MVRKINRRKREMKIKDLQSMLSAFDGETEVRLATVASRRHPDQTEEECRVLLEANRVVGGGDGEVVQPEQNCCLTIWVHTPNGDGVPYVELAPSPF